MFGLGPSVCPTSRRGGSARGARDVRLRDDDDEGEDDGDDVFDTTDDDVAMRCCDMATTT